MTQPRITLAVTPRESFYHTEASLESLLATVPAARIVYVDGGSPPWIARYLRKRSRQVPFELIRVNRFLSQNESRNIALRHLPASDYVLFVDNDIVFAPGWYERLTACALETGAGITAPLICIGDPPFETVHFVSGVARIDDTASGRRLHTEYHHAGRPLVAVSPLLRRESCEMVETHCMLVRSDLLHGIGAFDEGLLSGNDHVDLCLRARAVGATLYVEPAALVNQFLPRQLPGGWFDVPFFMRRWSAGWNRATIEHFRAKWDLRHDDPVLSTDARWLRDRWKHMFAPLAAPFTQKLAPALRRFLTPSFRK